MAISCDEVRFLACVKMGSIVERNISIHESRLGADSRSGHFSATFAISSEFMTVKSTPSHSYHLRLKMELLASDQK